MYILGISGMAHDSATALLADGRIVAAMEEGKLARTRSAEGIPRKAIQFCLDSAGIGWRELDRIAIASRPARAWSRETLFRARVAPRSPRSRIYFANKALGEFGRELNNLRILRALRGTPASRIAEFDHHLCHASSAYYASGYDRALIVTIDEHGDGRAGFIGLGRRPQIKEYGSIPLPHSVAWVFDNCKAPYRWCESEDHKIEEALRLLLSGKIVAWFQGAAEFGPRALGNRSLLAYPWASYVQENLNDYIKHPNRTGPLPRRSRQKTPPIISMPRRTPAL
jgi:predicted NodU family carbamoyl transferase